MQHGIYRSVMGATALVFGRVDVFWGVCVVFELVATKEVLMKITALRYAKVSLVGCVFFALWGLTTNCAQFAQKLNEFTQFCKAVGDKCSQQTAADCTQKLGASTTVLKSSPDYAAAKACVDALSSCTTLPDTCWFHAVERFTEAGPSETTQSDAGSQEK